MLSFIPFNSNFEGLEEVVGQSEYFLCLTEVDKCKEIEMTNQDAIFL